MDDYYCLGPLGIFFVLAGFYVGFRALKAWRLYRACENWIPIAGRVTKSEVEHTHGMEGESDSYTPLITYTYQLMGENYEGNRISFGSDGSSSGKRKKAERVVARHPLGSQPTIYYAPDDPSKSVLERKWDPNDVIFFLVLELVGAGLIYLDYQQW